MKTLYLSGPITGLNFKGATSWRDRVKELLAVGVRGVDPLRGKTQLLAQESDIAMCYPDFALSTTRSIYRRDIHDALTCDAMLINATGQTRENVSIGTVVEVGWVSTRIEAPIILVAPEPDNIFRHHPLLCEAMATIVDTIEEGAQVANNLLRYS